MTRQLNIRSDEAHRIAHEVADRLGVPVGDVVLLALREYGAKFPALDDLTPAQRADHEAILDLAREAAKHKRSDATSDHREFYDEFGLPI